MDKKTIELRKKIDESVKMAQEVLDKNDIIGMRECLEDVKETSMMMIVLAITTEKEEFAYLCEGLEKYKEMGRRIEKRLKKANTHNLKIKEKYLKALDCGCKTFELRRDDRGFKVGDLIHFTVVDEKGDEADKYCLDYEITYVLKDVPEYGLQKGYAVLSVRKADK